MKKLIAALFALTLALVLALTPVMAEETAAEAPTFMNDVQFGLNLADVQAKMNLANPEIENEATHGPVTFLELEYEDFNDGTFTSDLSFKFINDALVAIHLDLADGTSYDAVKDGLVKAFGEAVPFDAAKIGTGIFAVDDDGEMDDCKEMIVTENLIVVLEQDDDGDMDVTYLDPLAAYING